MRTSVMSRRSFQSIINHINSTPSSFSLIQADDDWLLSLNDSREKEVHIAILDSSFNPPTKAHLALASSSPPQMSSSKVLKQPSYTARLLLFTPKNAAKTPLASDATLLQRLEMMSLLASSLRSSNSGCEPVAIGLVHAPNFVNKAQILREYLIDTLGKQKGEEVRMSFLVGMDTLERIFDEKYYPSGEMNNQLNNLFETPPTGAGARLVSARRGSMEESRRLENDLMARPSIAKWVEKGNVSILGNGGEGWEDISSTLVRQAVRQEDWKMVEELVSEEIGEYIRRERLYAVSK
ncbi:hypothetical protein L204_101343 [Cryptococcus depauperatus]